MINKLMHKYALSKHGAISMIRAIIAVAISNLVLMIPMGLLYMLMTNVINDTLTKDKLGFFMIGIVGALVLIILSAIFQYRSCFLSTYVESGIRRRGLAEKLRRLPLSYFGKKDLADLTNTIMADCASIETASSHFIPELFGSIISSVVIVICLFFFDYRLALASTCVLPLSFLIVYLSKLVMNKLYQKSMASRIECLDGIQECLDTIRDIKANNMVAEYQKGLNKKIKAVEKNAIKSEFINASFVSTAQMILKVGIGLVALAGSILIAKNEISLITFVMFLFVASRMYEPLMVALQNLSAVISIKVNCSRMDEILSHDEQTGSLELTNNGYDIIFDNVDFSYNDQTKVLQNVSFKASEGNVTALIGPSGSGKTTITRLLMRFWDINNGKITVGGMDISKIDPEVLLGMYSIVFQDVTLFNNTVMENIRIGKKDATDSEVMAAAKLANCLDFIERLPNKWDTMIGENGSMLSGGERQRLSIARAFLKDAPIILMDEATASLDVDNETLIQEAISKLIKNKTVLIIAHRMRSVDGANDIVVLKDGSVCEMGTPEELAKQNGVYKHMHDLQKISADWKY